MARFVIRNYGPSRQIQYEDRMICLYHDQVIETDDEEMAEALKAEERIHVTDRGVEMATPVDLSAEEVEDKDRPVTADNAEALYDENYPDNDEVEVESDQAESEHSESEDEIEYKDMTVPELKTLAKDRQLRTTGLKKTGLIQLLQDYDLEDHSEDDLE